METSWLIGCLGDCTTLLGPKDHCSQKEQVGGPTGAAPSLTVQKHLSSLRPHPQNPHPSFFFIRHLLYADSGSGCKHASSHCITQSPKQVSCVLSNSMMRKLRHRLVNQLAQCHTANRWCVDQIWAKRITCSFPSPQSLMLLNSSCPSTQAVRPWTELKVAFVLLGGNTCPGAR